MSLNNILSIFAPKDAIFFPLLAELSKVMVKTSSLLHNLIAFTKRGQRADICKLIKTEETIGDKISDRIMKALNNTFITPFDREDINELADCIEEVIDIINRSAQKVLLFDPEKFPTCAIQMTGIIQSGTFEIQGAVGGLAHLKKSDSVFRKHYKKIKLLEEEADSVYEQGITELFHNETNAVELIKLKEIIQELEKAANKVNTTGKVLKTIFVKYA